MSEDYVPVETYLGTLPEHHLEEKLYDLSSGGIVPPNAKSVFVYSFITTQGEGSTFQRGYYEMSTSDGVNEFKQYMNVATGKDVTVINSANMWFPMKGEGKLKIKLICNNCEKGKKSIKGVTPANEEWSNVFVIGYKTV